MPLEVATNIAELDESYPLGGDPIEKGDDHLRLIKAVLKAQFPGALGDGLNAPILSNETELNYLQGLTGNVQDQFDALGLRVDTLEGSLNAEPGTRMVFYQAAAPTGWTQVTDHNDFMLRVVSTAGGGSGGTDSPIINNKTVAAHSHTASSSVSGNHNHESLKGEYPSSNTGPYRTTHDNQADFILATQNTPDTGQTTDGGDHSHTINVDNSTVVAWEPKYLDIILAEKD